MWRLVKDHLDADKCIEDMLYVSVDYSTDDVQMLVDTLYGGALPCQDIMLETFANICEDFELFSKGDLPMTTMEAGFIFGHPARSMLTMANLLHLGQGFFSRFYGSIGFVKLPIA